MSMDADHLDIYGAPTVMRDGFEAFIKKSKVDGTLIIKEEMLADLSDDVIEVLADRNVDVVLFGLNTDTEINVDEIVVDNGSFYFDYHSESSSLNRLKTNLAGRHNIELSLIHI